jgi:hypothetical protein
MRIITLYANKKSRLYMLSQDGIGPVSGFYDTRKWATSPQEAFHLFQVDPKSKYHFEILRQRGVEPFAMIDVEGEKYHEERSRKAQEAKEPEKPKQVQQNLFEIPEDKQVSEDWIRH